MNAASHCALVMLALAMPVQAQSPANPLRELQSAEGGVVVHYERATADFEKNRYQFLPE